MPDNKKEGINLKTLITGFLQALRQAKHLSDKESSRLIEVYKTEKTLSSFTVPAFTISDMEIELRFAVAGPAKETEAEGETPDIRVKISPESLKGFEAHHISQMRLKISPVSLRVFEEEKE